MDASTGIWDEQVDNAFDPLDYTINIIIIVSKYRTICKRSNRNFSKF